MSIKKLFTYSLLLTLSVTVFIGCRKKEDTAAVITVKDSNGAVVNGARVVLYPVSTQPGGEINVNVYDTAYTNPNGTARFSFNEVYQLGQAGVLVLNIEATSSTGVGEGIIKIEEETETEETVYI